MWYPMSVDRKSEKHHFIISNLLSLSQLNTEKRPAGRRSVFLIAKKA